jgi:hypothetical protein
VTSWQDQIINLRSVRRNLQERKSKNKKDKTESIKNTQSEASEAQTQIEAKIHKHPIQI